METLRNMSAFKVVPKVLCVAYNHTYRTRFYELGADGSYNKLESVTPAHHAALGRRHPWYIVGTGSCSGDSGGPLFVESADGNGHVLIGITSRGIGIRGNCGGLDNPTHNVRIKLFVRWIRGYVEDACLSSASAAAAGANLVTGGYFPNLGPAANAGGSNAGVPLADANTEIVVNNPINMDSL